MATTTPLPTVAETMAHPAFPTAIWDLEPDRKGLVSVAHGRGGPLDISWEIHGVGPKKIVFIMGLAGLKTGWQRQTLHFGHERRDEYSVLILDNRGIGASSKPLMRYSTSEMAMDLAEVLAHPSVGWLPSFPLPAGTPSVPRTLHIVGISMGGMIAQELALLIPGAISTLSLICTAAAIQNTTTFTENLANRASMLIPKSVDRSVSDTAHQLFAASWLTAPDDAHLPDASTTLGVKGSYGMFPTNFHRFAAQEMHKRLDPGKFGMKGFLLQLIAAGWHHKSAEQLAKMADEIGRERILVMHGTADGMISFPHGERLIEMVKPGRRLVVEGMGHVPLVERCEWFNGVVEEIVGVGEGLDGRR
ncbi:hypothetical protein C8A05DRAFT_16271 [Staphylotrichum tortipilum]|uniref:AB hydrolase-1 domain-containing protein n=1 Tax=Staphylotrichum tortipilum TaxID=2831512 RepID=A0AAN6RT50_9PEZI|nr:hypothetical protein C8A05DRAFT_16271 [Staphylotrichum longicolle]